MEKSAKEIYSDEENCKKVLSKRNMKQIVFANEGKSRNEAQTNQNFLLKFSKWLTFQWKQKTKKLAVKQRFEDDIELINYLDNYNHLGKAATSGIYTSHFIVDECFKM